MIDWCKVSPGWWCPQSTCTPPIRWAWASFRLPILLITMNLLGKTYHVFTPMPNKLTGSVWCSVSDECIAVVTESLLPLPALYRILEDLAVQSSSVRIFGLKWLWDYFSVRIKKERLTQLGCLSHSPHCQKRSDVGLSPWSMILHMSLHPPSHFTFASAACTYKSTWDRSILLHGWMHETQSHGEQVFAPLVAYHFGHNRSFCRPAKSSCSQRGWR